MGKCTAVIFSLFFCMNAYSGDSDANCITEEVILSLDVDSLSQCEEIKKGYTLQLCSDDSGFLVAEDGSIRYLFKSRLSDSEMWFARQDIVDYTSGISKSEIFEFNNQTSEVSISVAIAQKDSAFVERFTCKGYF